MSTSDLELQKMVKGFRVSDLQCLLAYASRNKVGKKNELQQRAINLVKLHSNYINIKIRELHMKRYQQSRHSDPAEMYPSATINDSVESNFSGNSIHKAPLGPTVGIPGYVPQINHQMLSSVPGFNVMPQYPRHPDVTFKDLPFYDVLAEVLKPTSLVPLRGDGLVQENELHFYLGPQDVRQLNSSSDVQVQLRIGILESNCEQEDNIPSTISITVNHEQANIPNTIPTNKAGQDPKRPKRPIDITSITKSTTEPQIVCVSWASSNNKPYVIGIYLVRKQTSDVLIKRLKDNGVRNPDQTTAMIKDLCHDRDLEVAAMSLNIKGSLICPLGKIKMTLPCRAISCTHLQCFDAHLYVQMNEKKPKWICPVCDKPAVFKSLVIDGLFLDISRKVPSECTEVEFHENGSWTPVMPVKKATTIHETAVEPEALKVEKQKKQPVEIISLSDSDTEEELCPLQPPKKKPYKPVGIISPVSLDTNKDSSLPQHNGIKSLDITQPCSSEAIPSTTKSNTLLIENSGSPQPSIYSGYIVHSASSPTFSPKSPVSEMPSISAFQLSLNVLNNSSSTAGQCYDFDLYSLIQPNTNETFEFQESVANDALSVTEEAPDIISID